MSLEVTQEEFDRLDACRTFCKYRKHYKITNRAEEDRIKNGMEAGTSGITQ